MNERVERLNMENRLLKAKNPYLLVPCDVLVVDVGYQSSGRPNRAWCVVRVKQNDGTYGRLRVVRQWEMADRLPDRMVQP